MKKFLSALLAITLCSFPALADQQGGDGVNVGKASSLRNLVPADKLEQAGGQQYAQMMQQAAEKGALAPDDHPQLQRLRAIAKRILPYASRFNPRAERWKWEVNLIGSKQLNAFCMPGGKIAFYTGIIDTLKLTDDEIAVVMGHEVAHALREHARARIAKSELTHGVASILSEIVAGTKYGGLAQFGIQGAANLTTLKFSRDDETEADAVGLDLAARAGFDPRAGVSLWQKMGAANSRGVNLAWFSTHPAGTDRIREMERHLPEVMPLYEAAKR
jgi:Zn-dependent protease with chaperone function